MPNRHNGMNYHTETPPITMTPGLQARANNLKEAYSQEASVAEARREGGHMMGMVSARKQTEVAYNALDRQIRYQRGQNPVRQK